MGSGIVNLTPFVLLLLFQLSKKVIEMSILWYGDWKKYPFKVTWTDKYAIFLKKSNYLAARHGTILEIK